MGLGFLGVTFESNMISTADSQSSGVQRGGKTPVALFLILPAPNHHKHGLFVDEASTEGRLGTGEASASAGQVLLVASVMAPLCMSPVYEQPWFVCLFFPSVCPLHPNFILPFP